MTRRELVHQLLQDAGPKGVTTGEFLRAGAGSRFGARVQELRDRGESISCERVRDGEFRYRLTDADIGGGGQHPRTRGTKGEGREQSLSSGPAHVSPAADLSANTSPASIHPTNPLVDTAGRGDTSVPTQGTPSGNVSEAKSDTDRQSVEGRDTAATLFDLEPQTRSAVTGRLMGRAA